MVERRAADRDRAALPHNTEPAMWDIVVPIFGTATNLALGLGL